MVPVTLVALLLLGVTAAQYLAAPLSADRFVRRRLTAPLDPATAGRLRRALVRRTRAQAVGGASAGVGVLVTQWLTVDDPLLRDGLLPRIALVLASVILAGVLAEVIVAVRDAPKPPAGVRQARLTARDPHLSRREAFAETALVTMAVALLVGSIVAMAAGIEHAGGAAICLAAAVGVALALIAVRRRVLDQPQPVGDRGDGRVHRLLTAASADRFSETLVANVAVLTAYPVLMLLPDASGVEIALGLALVLALAALVTVATTARSRAQVTA